MASQAKNKAELDTLTDFNIVDGTIGQVLTTDGAESFSFQNASLGTHTFVATGSISSGDIVGLRDDGTVEVVTDTTTSYTTSAGTPVVFESAYTQFTSVTFDSNTNTVVIAYTDNGNTQYGTAVVGTVSGDTISFGTPVIFNSNVTYNNKAIFDSNSNKVVIAYRNQGNLQHGTAVVGTVSGDTITFGTPVVFESAATSQISATFDSNSNKVVIAYQDGATSYGTAVVGTVSGTSISFGSPAVFESTSTSYNSATFDSNTNTVVIAYQDSGNSYYGTAVVGTVSGDTITFGTPIVFESANTGFISSTFDSNTNTVVIAYQDTGNSHYGTASVGTVSGTSISFGTPVVFESGRAENISTTFDSNTNTVVIAYLDDNNSNYGTAVVGTVSGTSISFGSPAVFESAGTFEISSTFDSNSNKVVIAYRDQGNSDYGTVSVFQAEGSTTTTNADSWIGIAAEDIVDSASGSVYLKSAIVDGFSGLIPREEYTVNETGSLITLATDDTYGLLGIALSSTELLIIGPLTELALPELPASVPISPYGNAMVIGPSSVEMMSFTDSSYNSSHGSLSTTRSATSGDSDRNQTLVCGGWSGSTRLISCEMIQFSSNTTGVSHGNLSDARYDLAAGSDETQVMTAGGNANVGPWSNTCDMKQFSSTATAVDHGDLNQNKLTLAGCSDRSAEMMCQGGYTGVSVTTAACQKKQFSSTATATAHGNLSVSRGYVYSGSDTVQAMVIGGYVEPSTVGTNTCDMVQFSSNTTAVDHGDLSQARHGVMAASNHNSELLATGGSTSSTWVTTVDKKQFASTATATAHGSLLTATANVAAASGN